MKTMRLLLAVALAAALGLMAFASSAQAAPILNLYLHHRQTYFPPGGTGEYLVDVSNVGDEDTSGPLTLTMVLPGGMKRKEVRSFGSNGWSCPGAAGETTIVCTRSTSFVRHNLYGNLNVEVTVPENAKGKTLTPVAKLEGGGSAGEVIAKEPTQVSVSGEEAPFGILAPSFTPDFFEADGLTTMREAGVHPELLTVPFDLASDLGISEAKPSGNVRDAIVDLPPGFVGNPTAVGECTQAVFTIGECPGSTQVGRIDLNLTRPLREVTAGIFNLIHPRGSLTDLAFVVVGNPVHIKASLDPANRYAIRSETDNINETLPPFDQQVTLWGVPADHSHDSERCASFRTGGDFPRDTSKECALDQEPKPFLTAPSQCEFDNVWRLHHYDSWQETGKFGPEIDYTEPGHMTDCEKPRFEPEVEIEPTGHQANTPTGLDVHVKIAQNDNPNALNTPPVQRFTVTLPEGMSFSPSFADGLKSCTLAQMQLGNNKPVQCPDASRIGEVELHTPILPRSAEGSMYLAAQGDNPFGSTFALLLVIHDTEERGAIIKMPGRIDVDEETGQIVTTFEDTPQFPFDDLTLKFRSGPRAPLVSPPTCGRQTIGIEVASYAQPKDPVDASNHYQVTEGPGGTPCPPDPAKRPFAPSFDAGTLNPVAGHYSTFLFRLKREDSEQELSQVSTTLPEGLVAKIAGVSLCPEQAIASISTALGSGRAELEHPACPASSFLGTVSAGLGAGPGPNYFPGTAYLAGPYKGAPLSLAVIAPGIAGPFDLGNVVVRTALYVDPDTGVVKAVTDPFPTILHGVLLRARDIRLRLDRPETTINPTDCEPMSVKGQITGVGGSILTTADDSLFDTAAPFQVGSCADLGFEPKLSFRLFGGTHRGAHPKLRATVRFPEGRGDANTAFASVALPHSEFLDQGHIGTVCTRVQFAEEKCPPASIYGFVKAKTPLLDEVLSGPIYLRSSSHTLPDVVAAFRGGRIDANLDGRVDSIHGGIRNTFEAVPDVPVSWATFTFQGGKKGLLVNSRDVCVGTPRVAAHFKAQNGAALTLHPPLLAKCGKTGGRRHHQRRR